MLSHKIIMLSFVSLCASIALLVAADNAGLMGKIGAWKSTFSGAQSNVVAAQEQASGMQQQAQKAAVKANNAVTEVQAYKGSLQAVQNSGISALGAAQSGNLTVLAQQGKASADALEALRQKKRDAYFDELMAVNQSQENAADNNNSVGIVAGSAAESSLPSMNQQMGMATANHDIQAALYGSSMKEKIQRDLINLEEFFQKQENNLSKNDRIVQEELGALNDVLLKQEQQAIAARAMDNNGVAFVKNELRAMDAARSQAIVDYVSRSEELLERDAQAIMQDNAQQLQPDNARIVKLVQQKQQLNNNKMLFDDIRSKMMLNPQETLTNLTQLRAVWVSNRPNDLGETRALMMEMRRCEYHLGKVMTFDERMQYSDLRINLLLQNQAPQDLAEWTKALSRLEQTVVAREMEQTNFKPLKQRFEQAIASLPVSIQYKIGGQFKSAVDAGKYDQAEQLVVNAEQLSSFYSDMKSVRNDADLACRKYQAIEDSALSASDAITATDVLLKHCDDLQNIMNSMPYKIVVSGDEKNDDETLLSRLRMKYEAIIQLRKHREQIRINGLQNAF